MSVLRWAFLAAGAVVLVLVAREADLGAVGAQVARFGLPGFAVVLLIYAVEFLADTAGWQATLRTLPGTVAWTGRLFLVRLVGEAFNTITPLGGIGGEPVKAVLLRQRFAVAWAEAIASLVLARTVNLMALLVFLAAGFALMLADPRFGPAFDALAAAGLAAFATAVLALFLVQRHRVSSRLGARLGRTRLGARLLAVLHHVEDFDERLAGFYRDHRARFLAAFALGLANWVVGAAGVWATFALLGNPIGAADAWILEAAAQLVRAGAFFIPAALGAQEGAVVVVTVILIGDPSAGLAAALVRRARELVWVAAGLGIGSLYSVRRTDGARAAPGEWRE